MGGEGGWFTAWNFIKRFSHPILSSHAEICLHLMFESNVEHLHDSTVPVNGDHPLEAQLSGHCTKSIRCYSTMGNNPPRLRTRSTALT